MINLSEDEFSLSTCVGHRSALECFFDESVWGSPASQRARKNVLDLDLKQFIVVDWIVWI